MSGGRIGLGCAGLMRLAAAKARRRLLDEAFERGIRHFDVARMYGLGAAEGELGRFARGRREELFIATKFGIDPSGAIGRLAPLQAPARAVLARFPALRATLRRREGALHESGDYSPAKARASLEMSLRELGTDHVDLFLVHGPGRRDTIAAAELGAELETLRSRGLIGAWGLAGEPRMCRRLAAGSGLEPVLQLRDSVLSPVSDVCDVPAKIVYGLLSGALERIGTHLAADPSRRAEWAAAIGIDCGEPTALAQLLLSEALDRNREATILFGTTRPERIAAAVAAGELEADLTAFRDRVRSELGELVGAA